MRTSLVVASLAIAVPASAEPVGVVVTGDATLQPPVTSQLEGWLHDRGRSVTPGALEPSAINTLIDCFVLEDLGCARGLIDARAKTRSVIYAVIEVTPDEDGTRDISITTYWFQKERDVMFERRVCEDCTTDALHTMIDGQMLALMHLPPPIIALPAVVVAPVPAPAVKIEKPDQRMRFGIMAAGAVGLLAGTVLLAMDQDPNPMGTQQPTYRDTATGGVLLGLAGATTMVLGYTGSF